VIDIQTTQRSVNYYAHFHENAQRRSSITRSSKDFQNKQPTKEAAVGKFKFSALKKRFEQEIAAQSHAVRRDSLRGQEAKEELERVRRLTNESLDRLRQMRLTIDTQQPQTDHHDINIGAPSAFYSADKPKPKKLIKRIDNPWVAKLRREGIKQPQRLARIMPKSNIKHVPRRINRKKGDQSPIAEVTNRSLPPAPIQKRRLPELPQNARRKYKRAQSNASPLGMDTNNYDKNGGNADTEKDKKYEIVDHPLTFQMKGRSMTFSYTPAPSVQRRINIESKDKKMDLNANANKQSLENRKVRFKETGSDGNE